MLGPSVLSVFIRAGWYIGKVQTQYLFEGQGQDQHCGRIAAGLDYNGYDLSLLVPHFLSLFNLLSPMELAYICPNLVKFAADHTFRTIIPFLIASIVHHRVFIDRSIALTHPLRFTNLWTSGVMEVLAPHVCFLLFLQTQFYF